ncbi:MAG: DUF6364 family protein [Chloroflexota bacterium]|nr:DUF6364 family protein [Chloroflexota bacterium]
MQTKTKLTVTIDSEILPRAKDYARTRGVSLSSVIEQILRDKLKADSPAEGTSWAAGKTPEEIAEHLPFETEEERAARWNDTSLPFGTRLWGQAQPETPLTDQDLDDLRYQRMVKKYGPFD